jgi:hypothetical protein
MLIRPLVNRCVSRLVSTLPVSKTNSKLTFDLFKEKPWLNPFDDMVRVGTNTDYKKRLKVEESKSVDDYETHKSIQHMLNMYSG